MAWTTTAVFGGLPYLLTGAIGSPVSALFEAMSGFTPTGATVFLDIEALPHGVLLWRSMTHWLRGMGIIVLVIAVLPYLGVGGMQLFRAEVPGPTPERLRPRIGADRQAALVRLLRAHGDPCRALPDRRLGVPSTPSTKPLDHGDRRLQRAQHVHGGDVAVGLPWTTTAGCLRPPSAVLTFLMLLGRLEIYTVVLLFHPEMWRSRSSYH